MRTFLVAIAVVSGFAVHGQVFQVEPASPTSAEGNPDYTIVNPPYILVVAPAMSPAYIPALSPAALALLAAAMAVGGAVLLRR